jgi:hypothetical protein
MKINRATVIATVAIAAMAAMAFASTASAKSLYFVGHADDDSDTTIHFKAKGHYEKKKSKKKKFVADEVSSIRVYDQHFICWTANGTPTGISGRSTYSGYALIDPLQVDKKGRFGGFYQSVYKSPYGGPPSTTEYERFRGRIRNKTATGAYQTQASETGIEYGYCGDREPVDWTAKAQKKAPEPPPDPLSAPTSSGTTLRAKNAIRGSLTLKVKDGGEGDGFASGRIDTKKICGAFRQIRVKLLDPPRGYRQAEPTYGEPNRKHYTATMWIPREPGTYRFRAVAKKTRVARGLRRAKCAKLTSPVAEVTVDPPPPEEL